MRVTRFIKDQSDLSACTACAVATAVEAWKGDEAFEASLLFLYHNARRMHPHQSGLMLADAIAAVVRYGVCSEQAWPCRLELLAQKPTAEAYRQGREARPKVALPVVRTVDKVNALRRGWPLVQSLSVEVFARCGQEVSVPLSTRHAVALLRGDEEGCLAQNSWGAGWGDGGRCRVPWRLLEGALGGACYALRS